MTDEELLQQALDALISVWNMDKTTKQVETIQAIKARLTQPDADAVAWVDEITLRDLKNGKEGVHLVYEEEMVGSTPLFEYPPEKEWIGLTQKETIDLLPDGEWAIEPTLIFAKRIEAKLKEKNHG